MQPKIDTPCEMDYNESTSVSSGCEPTQQAIKLLCHCEGRQARGNFL